MNRGQTQSQKQDQNLSRIDGGLRQTMGRAGHGEESVDRTRNTRGEGRAGKAGEAGNDRGEGENLRSTAQ